MSPSQTLLFHLASLIPYRFCATQMWFFPSPIGFQFFGTDYSPFISFRVWFLIIFTVHIEFYVSGSQQTSTPSFAARRCRCTWSCSSSSWLGCQSRDRMRSMLRAYIVWEGITPWWTYIRPILQQVIIYKYVKQQLYTSKHVLQIWLLSSFLFFFFLPVKPLRDQTCWLVGGVQEDCQKNKPISEQLVAQLHQVTLEVVGQQGEKHLEGDWKKEKH